MKGEGANEELGLGRDAVGPGVQADSVHGTHPGGAIREAWVLDGSA